MADVFTYNIAAHRRGDTWGGLAMTVTVNGSVVDLTGCSIRMQCRKKYTPIKVYELSTASGDIELTDPTNGIFTILPKIVNFDASAYNYDIQFTFPSGLVRTYVAGTWTINQDITQ